MQTRCKFYVTSVNETAGVGGSIWKRVSLNAGYSQNPGTETNSFWKATPNGTLSFSMPSDEAGGFAPGTWWYIDVIPLAVPLEFQDDSEEHKYVEQQCRESRDVWRLVKLERTYGSSLVVKLVNEFPSANGVFECSIDNKGVWPVFDRLLRLYTLRLSPAEKD